jgi:hypothetical protein
MREKTASRKKENQPGNNALKLISFHAERKFSIVKTLKGELSRVEMVFLIGIKLFFIRCEAKLRKFILTAFHEI